MDASGFIDATKLSRSEARQLSKDIEAARTPLENYTVEHDKLRRALQDGSISFGVYSRLLDAQREKHGIVEMGVRDYASALTGPLAIGLGIVAAATTAAIATTVAFVSHMKETQDQIDSVVDSATKLGVSYNELQGLRFAAQEGGGVDAATVDASIKKMQINIANAVNDPSSAVNEAFKRLGVNAGQLMQAGPVESMKLLADGMQGVNSQADRLQLSMEVFGKSGTEMVSTLAGGRDAIAEAVDFQNKWNGLTDAQVIAVGMSNDAWDRIGVVIDGISTKMAAEFAPAFLVVAEQVLGVAGGIEGIDEGMQFVVNTTAYYLGQLKDVTELFISMPKALMGMNVSEAFDFSSGQKAMQAVIDKRQEMESSATAKEAERKLAREKMLAEEHANRLTAAEKKAADAAYNSMMDRVIAEENKRIEMEDKLARNALQAAENKFKKEREDANKLRADIAKSPTGMEAGSQDAARFLADQANAAIAASVVPDQAKPTDEQLVEEAAKQTKLLEETKLNQDKQLAELQKLVAKEPQLARAR